MCPGRLHAWSFCAQGSRSNGPRASMLCGGVSHSLVRSLVAAFMATHAFAVFSGHASNSSTVFPQDFAYLISAPTPVDSRQPGSIRTITPAQASIISRSYSS